MEVRKVGTPHISIAGRRLAGKGIDRIDMRPTCEVISLEAPCTIRSDEIAIDGMGNGGLTLAHGADMDGRADGRDSARQGRARRRLGRVLDSRFHHERV